MIAFQVCVIAFCLVESSRALDAPPVFSFPCHFLDTCLKEYGRVSEVLSKLELSDVESLVRDYNDAMDNFCHTGCPRNTEFIYYTCTLGTSTKDQLSVSLCAPSTGDECPVRVVDDEGASVTRFSCDSDTCDATCWSTIGAVHNYLGCCAKHLYQDNWAFKYFIPTSEGASCGVDLRSLCPSMSTPLGLVSNAHLPKVCTGVVLLGATSAFFNRNPS